MQRVLVVVRNDEPVDQLERVIRSLGRSEDVHVVVLSVQPAPVTWQTRGLQKDAIKARLLDRGQRACGALVERLQASGTAYHMRVEIDHEPAAISRTAREERCTSVVVQDERPSWLQRQMERVVGLRERVKIDGPAPVMVVA